MPLIKRTDTELIELPADGEWVRLARTMSKGARVAILQAAAKNSKVKVGGDNALELDGAEAIGAITFALLDQMLIEWSFQEPVTPANIRTLDEESCDFIQEEIERRGMYPQMRDEAEKKVSSPNTPTPLSVVETSPLN